MGATTGNPYQSDARGGATFEARADEYWKAVTGRCDAKRGDR